MKKRWVISKKPQNSAKYSLRNVYLKILSEKIKKNKNINANIACVIDVNLLWTVYSQVKHNNSTILYASFSAKDYSNENYLYICKSLVQNHIFKTILKIGIKY